MDGIENCDLWWFRELYSILMAFADEPRNTISRIGENVFETEDLAEDLHHFRECILEKYPDTNEFDVMKTIGEIDSIFDRKSLCGDAFEESFWTNQGFEEHPDWGRIRARAKSFLLR